MIEMYLFNIKVFIYTKSKWLKKKEEGIIATTSISISLVCRILPPAEFFWFIVSFQC